MGQQWEEVAANEVRPGDRVRVRDVEIEVSRVEDSFLNRENMVALIEDTDARWLKVPVPADAPVQVSRGA